jgi:hypothetical protein
VISFSVHEVDRMVQYTGFAHTKGLRMQTLRLRQVQLPSRVQTLLDAFASSADILPEGCYQIRDRSTLPAVLQCVVIQAAHKDRVWSCWTDDHRMWLFTGEMSMPLSRERGSPVLQVNLYGEDAKLADSGPWVADREGKWQRCAD